MLTGLLGVLFFALIDPRYGLANVWSDTANPIDAANEAFYDTIVGVVCSIIVLMIGLWLMRRRTV